MRNHWWWRPGWSIGRRFYTWHLTFDGQADVHRLAAEYRSALAPFGTGLTPVPDRWLHLTMQGIGFVGETTEQDVNTIVEVATTRLAAIPAFDLRIGPDVLDPEAVLLRVHPDGPVRNIRNAIREAIGEVLGEIPEKAEGFTPHVSVAYSAGAGPAEPVAHLLDGIDLAPAQARISSAELIVIHRDNRMYEWESFARVPLG
ncbi:2'-5' RNA ligase family protein [Streptomyces griseiscabiei]|uniref:2'-5' RNA ligase family protein n=2 Tax=Streptomyces griseiscabiei TaxID=2993540 RepID=A0ABU4LLL9_9ACTN|nr:2'-5' RNA ligase family protein [Streptomyces griseiscabiei]MBZ3906554.1 2'-5' RNA ligase family protein [Streptomyces griseiscabiei]MDX2916155.1 2'-5' RNA ligase family protein [Streptomyces griseiscabiei]